MARRRWEIRNEDLEQRGEREKENEKQMGNESSSGLPLIIIALDILEIFVQLFHQQHRPVPHECMSRYLASTHHIIHLSLTWSVHLSDFFSSHSSSLSALRCLLSTHRLSNKADLRARTVLSALISYVFICVPLASSIHLHSSPFLYVCIRSTHAFFCLLFSSHMSQPGEEQRWMSLTDKRRALDGRGTGNISDVRDRQTSQRRWTDRETDRRIQQRHKGTDLSSLVPSILHRTRILQRFHLSLNDILASMRRRGHDVCRIRAE